jgi:hypothetical protein
MGFLHYHNLDNYIVQYKLTSFIETGTAGGDGVAHALLFPFQQVSSIEIDEGQFKQTAARFEGCDEVRLVNAGSIEGLVFLLQDLVPDARILFWLDAHFPGEMQGAGYGDEKDMSKRLPLASELRTIQMIRGNAPDVFIIDDLRIYEDGPFGNGNWCDRRTLGGDGIGFIDELYGDTHEIRRDYAHEGYVILVPKTLESNSQELGLY